MAAVVNWCDRSLYNGKDNWCFAADEYLGTLVKPRVMPVELHEVER